MIIACCFVLPKWKLNAFSFSTARFPFEKLQTYLLFFFILGKLDENVLKTDTDIATIFRAVCLTANWLIYDENVQVHGMKYIVDWTNVTFQHATRIYKPEHIKKLFHFFQVRIHSILSLKIKFTP